MNKKLLFRFNEFPVILMSLKFIRLLNWALISTKPSSHNKEEKKTDERSIMLIFFFQYFSFCIFHHDLRLSWIDIDFIFRKKVVDLWFILNSFYIFIENFKIPTDNKYSNNKHFKGKNNNQYKWTNCYKTREIYMFGM